MSSTQKKSAPVKGRNLEKKQNRPAQSVVDYNIAEQFLKALDPDAEKFCFQSIHDKKDKALPVQHLTIKELKQLSRKVESGYGTFVSINPIADGERRTKGNVVAVRAVYADDDVRRSEPRTDFKLKPSIIVESSPGKYHYYWLCLSNGKALSIDQGEGIKKAIAREYETDAEGVKGPNRVLRVAGYIHQKDEPFQSNLSDCNGKRYSVDELIDAFGCDDVSSSKGGEFVGDDLIGNAILQAFIEDDAHLRKVSEGEHYVVCPWADNHTNPDDNRANLMLAGTGGYDRANYYCHHSCSQTIYDVAEHYGVDIWAIKMEQLAGVFDVLPDEPSEMSKNSHLDSGGSEPKNKKKTINIPSLSDLTISILEAMAAQSSPRCIVEDYLYADVATLVAPGGVGKTTMTLYEKVHIALGRRLWGLDIRTPGKCLLITAEDSREICIARLWSIITAMELNSEETQTVLDNIMIWDVSGEQMKLVETNRDIVLTELADTIVEKFAGTGMVLVTFDPLVSFGASENAVNDNEQALITAARRIKAGLDCCVRYVAHTGQAAALEKRTDQYASRGGSALSDGARMVAVLQNWSPNSKGDYSPPEGKRNEWLGQEATITLLARAKLSYTKPQPILWIARTGSGYEFDYCKDFKESKEDRDKGYRRKLLRYLIAELEDGVKLTRTDLREDSAFKEIAATFTRAKFDKALKYLIDHGEVTDKALPADECQGGRKTYLHPNESKYKRNYTMDLLK